jgi:hypothetical protein
MANTDGSPHVDEVNISVYLNHGPDFDDKKSPEDLFSASNSMGKPISMEVYSSINSMYRYGTITFQDNIGIRETLPLTGNEILTVLYKNTITGSETSITGRLIHFNIVNIEEIQLKPASSKDERFTYKGLKFHIIEAPFFLKYNKFNIQRVFGKDLGNGVIEAPKINEIIESVLLDDVKINEKIFNIDFHEMTKNVFRVSCPNWRPQQFFKYLLEYARDSENNGNVKLFTSSNPETGLININLKSILGMYKKPNRDKIFEYSLVDESTLKQYEAGVSLPFSTRNINTIYYYKFLTYDLTTVSSGLAGGTLYNYDYSNGYYTLHDTYTNSNKNNKYFTNFAIWSDSISDWKSKAYYLGSLPETVGRNYLNNRITEHQNQVRCMAMTMINEEIEVGDVVFISFMSGMTSFLQGQQHLLDEQMSGGWLVEDVVDVVNYGKGYRKYVLVKDSFFNIYEPDVGNKKNNLPQATSVTKEG